MCTGGRHISASPWLSCHSHHPCVPHYLGSQQTCCSHHPCAHWQSLCISLGRVWGVRQVVSTDLKRCPVWSPVCRLHRLFAHHWLAQRAQKCPHGPTIRCRDVTRCSSLLSDSHRTHCWVCKHVPELPELRIRVTTRKLWERNCLPSALLLGPVGSLSSLSATLRQLLWASWRGRAFLLDPVVSM